MMPTLQMVARAIAVEMLNDYEEDGEEFSITWSRAEGAVVRAAGKDGRGQPFEFAVEVTRA